MFYFSAAAGVLFVLWGSVLFTKIYRNQNQEPLEAVRPEVKY
jgi:hypothetical protein